MKEKKMELRVLENMQRYLWGQKAQVGSIEAEIAGMQEAKYNTQKK